MNRQNPPHAVAPYLHHYLAALVGSEIVFVLVAGAGVFAMQRLLQDIDPTLVPRAYRAIATLATLIGWVRIGLFLRLVYETTRAAGNRGIPLSSSPALAAMLCCVPVLNVFALGGHIRQLIDRSAPGTGEPDTTAATLRSQLLLYGAAIVVQFVVSQVTALSARPLIWTALSWVLSWIIAYLTYKLFDGIGKRVAAYDRRAGEYPAYA